MVNMSHPVWVCGLKHFKCRDYGKCHLSHPVWVCGLKRLIVWSEIYHYDVTPCMGVWIETKSLARLAAKFKSHPVWVCGLKHYRTRKTSLYYRSHPVWVCGLKQRDSEIQRFRESHTLYGCVD